jgi:uncharacterized protein YcbK (DUF882 family)
MNSKSRTPQRGEPALTRRRFLKRASLLCGAAGALATLPAVAAVDRRPRVLQFVHTHTGEALVAPYFDGAGYRADTLRDVNHLLRDFRTDETHVIDPPLLDILYELQLLADRDATYEIISGYRSPTTNAMLRGQSHGVAEHSQHLLGKAIDVRLSGFPTRQLGEYARSLARGGVGYYASSDFIHLDTSRVRFW